MGESRMSNKTEYRLWTKSDGIWDRWSGGVKQTKEEWLDVAKRDSARREREGRKALQYGISRRDIIDQGIERVL